MASLDTSAQAIRRAVGRKKLWSEDTIARFAAGTFARITAVSRKKEDRTDFIREAVEREIRRREKLAERREKPEGGTHPDAH